MPMKYLGLILTYYSSFESYSFNFGDASATFTPESIFTLLNSHLHDVFDKKKLFAFPGLSLPALLGLAFLRLKSLPKLIATKAVVLVTSKLIPSVYVQ